MRKKVPLTRERSAVELWWRNPQFYIKQCVEVGTFNFVWDSGYLAKRRIDHRAIVSTWAKGHYWRSLVIDAEDAKMYDSENPEPVSVWPVWSAANQDWGDLCKLAKVNLVVIVKDLPRINSKEGQNFREDLSAVQEDYPETKLFVHGSYDMKVMFGSGFMLADAEPRTDAAKGRVFLHGGRKLPYEDVVPFWLKLFGLNKRDLAEPAERCKFNIEMLLWNAAYWNTIKKFAVRKGLNNTAEMDEVIYENSLVFTSRIRARAGDRVACSDCSLWLHCKYFREGDVCAVPKTQMSGISELFGTRDSSKIIEGLGKLLAVQVDRAESGIAAEQDPDNEHPGKIDPALNKLMKDIETGATSLLMLMDPAYRQTGKVQVNVLAGSGQAQVVSAEQAGREVTQRAIAQLESQGYKREDINADMVKNVVAQMIGEGPQQAIGPA